MDQRIAEWFDEEYEFYSSVYEKGEFLIEAGKPNHRLIFVLEGEVAVYSVNEEGNLYPVARAEGFHVLGDMEYATGKPPHFHVEALCEVRTVWIDMERNRTRLNDDRAFLRHIIKELTGKIDSFESQTTFHPSVEERLLLELQVHKEISSLEKLSYRLHCSRRQLIRVMNKLVGEGVIERPKKGCYILKKEVKTRK